MIKFKICGLRDPDNIRVVTDLGPDYMGFIFWSKSSRFVNTATPTLPNSIKKTGVFVDESSSVILNQIKKHKLNALQLHGSETPKMCQVLKEAGSEVIKAFSVGVSFDFKKLEPYLFSCDFFLFDTKGLLPGGNGYSFDWSILANYPYEKPFFLSGGIGLDDLNALKVIIKEKLPLYAIDVNSKFEIAPGYKDLQKLKEFKTQWDELQR
ncbi:MAG: phosphoribosylanthranilate isomerase [Flavobacteriaceae bacterium]